MLYIVLISAVLFIIGGIGTGLYAFLAFLPSRIMMWELWRLVTWVFFPPSGNIFFLAIALYFYYMIGSTLEREWGVAKFTVYYIIGLVLNVVYGFIIYFAYGTALDIFFFSPLTPLYLNFSMLFAFATLFPDFVIRLFLVIPIKIKWLALFNAVFFLYEIIQQLVAGNYLIAFLPIVASLNYVIVCGDDLLSYIRPLKVRTSPQVVNFKKAAKQVKREMADKPYRHKCAVCGKTDTEYPDLEFRYCSRCNGYHCFCNEHINNHIHFE